MSLYDGHGGGGNLMCAKLQPLRSSESQCRNQATCSRYFLPLENSSGLRFFLSSEKESGLRYFLPISHIPLCRTKSVGLEWTEINPIYESNLTTARLVKFINSTKFTN